MSKIVCFLVDLLIVLHIYVLRHIDTISIWYAFMHMKFSGKLIFYQVSKPNSKKSILLSHVICRADHFHFGQIDHKILV